MASSKLWKSFSLLLLSIILTVPLATTPAQASGSGEYSLEFNPGTYTTKVLATDERAITYRACLDIVYVSDPVDIDYQSMNI